MGASFPTIQGSGAARGEESGGECRLRAAWPRPHAHKMLTASQEQVTRCHGTRTRTRHCVVVDVCDDVDDNDDSDDDDGDGDAGNALWSLRNIAENRRETQQ